MLNAACVIVDTLLQIYHRIYFFTLMLQVSANTDLQPKGTFKKNRVQYGAVHVYFFIWQQVLSAVHSKVTSPRLGNWQKKSSIYNVDLILWSFFHDITSKWHEGNICTNHCKNDKTLTFNNSIGRWFGQFFYGLLEVIHEIPKITHVIQFKDSSYDNITCIHENKREIILCINEMYLNWFPEILSALHF